MTVSETHSDIATNDETLSRALFSAERPRRPGALSASVTFGKRALLRIGHAPQDLVILALFPIMFTLLFTYLFGGAIAGSTGDYLQYVLPGVVVMTVVMMTPQVGIALNTEIGKGIFDRFRTLPIWQPSALVGALFGDAVRYLLSSVVVVAFGLLIGFRPAGGFVGVLLALLVLQVFAFSLAWAWILLGMTVKTPSSLQQLSTAIQFPLMFASNLFVSPDTMPGWLRTIVNVNPISAAGTATRGLMNDTLTAGQLAWAAVACGALIVLFAPAAMVKYLARGKH
jgi:ABC-2 type transport system permease protein